MFAQLPNQHHNAPAPAPAFAAEYHNQYEQHQHMHQCDPHHMAEGPAACAVCLTQQVPFPGAACSRRCDWVLGACCPQCGRGRGYASPTVFCSPSCANQARQANWCVGCGVRQIPHGQQSCLMPACAETVDRLLGRYGPQPNASSAGFRSGRRGSDSSSASTTTTATTTTPLTGPAPHHRYVKSAQSIGALRSRRHEPHARLAASDKLFGAVRQQVGPEVAKRLTAVIKAGGPVESRKAYTAYRCRVELELNEVCGVGAPKFGHGGEGNEHRRFVALSMACDGPAAADADCSRTCHAPECQLCAFLGGGLAAAFADAETIPAYSNAAKAIAAAPSATGASAVLVCRVTVGNPTVCLAAEDAPVTSVAAVQRVPLEDKVHSRVVKFAHHDVAHMPTEVASVDAQYVTIAAPAATVADTTAVAAPHHVAAAATTHSNTARPRHANSAKKRGPRAPQSFAHQ